jgi:hypothetical protein
MLLASRTSNFSSLLAITRQRPRSCLDGWFGRFEPKALMFETIFPQHHGLETKIRRNVRERDCENMETKQKTNLIHTGGRRRSHFKRKMIVLKD